MENPSGPRVVALDGGTTNTRARLLQGGRVLATARRAVGVRDTVRSGSTEPLCRAVRSAIEEVLGAAGGAAPDLVVAAGMLSSEVGLAAVPHVTAPAGIEELARGVVLFELPGVAGQPVAFVPGVRTPAGPGPDGWAEADVMRGEECETLGAWSLLPRAASGRSAFLWPGSHTKLVEVDEAGRIVRSHTTLAGELAQALAKHSLLAASLPGQFPEDPDPGALEAGARLVAREGLGRTAFLVRVADLSGALGPHGRASFWLGAVLADDVDHLAGHPILRDACPVWVGGRQPQRSLYAARLAVYHSGPVTPLDDECAEAASALGAAAVARRAPGRDGSPAGRVTLD